MKEMYMAPLMGIYKKMTNLLQQNLLLQTTKSEQMDRYQRCRIFLERILRLFDRFPSNIPPNLTEEKLLLIERQIIDFIKLNMTKRNIFSQQQGQQQFRPSGPQSPQTQISQLQHGDNQMNTQMQAKNFKTMDTNTVLSFQHDSMPSLPAPSGAQLVQSNLVNTLQTSSALDSLHGSTLSSLQQGAVGSLQKIPMKATQQDQINLSSQNDVNALQPIINSIHLKSNALHDQHLKQQLQQCQLSHQLIQQQQEQQRPQPHHPHKLLQDRILQQKLQQSTQLSTHKFPQPYQINGISDIQGKQSTNLKLGRCPHQTTGQQLTYNHQPSLKSGAFTHTSSPMHLQSPSPRTSHHSSPQIDQQSMISSSLLKSGSPQQLTSSPRYPFSPLSPSSVPGDNDKQSSCISSHSNAGDGEQRQAVTSGTQSQSIVIGTPGVSPPPFLAEFASPDNNQGPAPKIVSEKKTELDKPIERLIKLVDSMSHKAFNASVSDIASVVSMVDSVAELKLGTQSKSALHEDLVGTVKCRVLADELLPECEIGITKNIKCHSSSVPLRVAPSNARVNDSFRHCTGTDTSDLESTDTSSIKRPRVEVIKQELLKEIKEINQRLVNTVVDINEDNNNLASAVNEVGQGTVVKCSFTAFFHRQHKIFPVLTICLLVASNYPNCSPIPLDEFSCGLSKEHEDLLVKARSQFSRSIRCLSQPISIREMARSWDTCVRAVILDYAVKNGGGSFSTQYGTWQNVRTSSS